MDDMGFPYKKNESELSIDFPLTGGRFQVFGQENEEALRGASNWGHVVGDEYDTWKNDVIQFIVLPNLLVHRAGLTIAGTPKGKAGLHSLETAEDENGNRLFKSWHYTSYDNPSIPKSDIDQLARWARAKGEDFFMQEIMAEYVKPHGVVYKEFDEQTQVSGKVTYRPDLPLHLTFDFGVRDPTVIIWIQPAENGFLNVIDYHEESNADIDHFVALIKAKGYRISSLNTGDPAGKARQQGTATSVIDEYRKKGIYITTRPIPNIPTQILKTHEIIPRLRIAQPTHGRRLDPNDPSHRGTGRFIDVLNNYRYDEEKDQDNNPKEPLPIHNQWSHGARALEYYAYIAGAGYGDAEDTSFPEFNVFTNEGFYLGSQ